MRRWTDGQSESSVKAIGEFSVRLAAWWRVRPDQRHFVVERLQRVQGRGQARTIRRPPLVCQDQDLGHVRTMQADRPLCSTDQLHLVRWYDGAGTFASDTGRRALPDPSHVRPSAKSRANDESSAYAWWFMRPARIARDRRRALGRTRLISEPFPARLRCPAESCDHLSSYAAGQGQC